MKSEEGRGNREEGRGKREKGRGKREEGSGKREKGIEDTYGAYPITQLHDLT